MSGIIFGLVLSFTSSASAQNIVDSPSADETFLTIYPDNLAMVTEVRKIDVPAGISTIRLLGVSDQIISQTAVLQSFEGLSLERNFDSDLVTKGTLLQNSVGKTLTLRRYNVGTDRVEDIDAELVSAPYHQYHKTYAAITGAVFKIDEQLESLDCSGLYESVLFDAVPNGLSPVPVLSLYVKTDVPGEKEIALSYLTQGLEWEADYRLNVDSHHKNGHLSGWLTLTNNTSKNYTNVPVAIVAGNLNRTYKTQVDVTPRLTFKPMCWPRGTTKDGVRVKRNADPDRPSGDFARSHNVMKPSLLANSPLRSDDEIVVTGSRIATQENFGDYKLYRIPQPVTVAPHQTKQVAFLDVPDIETLRLHKFEFDYEFTRKDTFKSAKVGYEIDNSREGKLARPLPKGVVRVMSQRSNGQTAYLGFDLVPNLALDLPVEIDISKSIAVNMRPHISSLDVKGNSALRLQADISNASPANVMAEIEFPGNGIRGEQIAAESHPRNRDDIIPTYKVPVPAESRVEFYIDLPVERSYKIDRDSIYYPDNDPGDKQTAASFVEYRLKGQLGGEAWPSVYFDQQVSHLVRIDAELLKFEEFTNAAGDDRTRLTERLTFSNTTDAPARIRFEFPDYFYGNVDLRKASMKPVYTNPLTWIFTVPAGKHKTLHLSFEADY